MDQLIQTLQPYFTEKAPWQMPEVWRQNIVRYAPWVVLVVFILSLPAVLAIIGLSAFVGVFAPLGGVGFALTYWIAVLALIVQEVLLIASFPGLKNRTISGWNLTFYASLFSLAHGVIDWLSNPLFNFGSLIGAVIGAAISWYILFQIREYYTGKKELPATTPASPAK